MNQMTLCLLLFALTLIVNIISISLVRRFRKAY